MASYLHGWVLDLFSDIVEVVPTVIRPKPCVKCSGDIPQGKGRAFEYIFQMLGIPYIKTKNTLA
jgi:hypothetical protein